MTTETLYLTEPGDTAAVAIGDVHQGPIGDCYLLATIIALTKTHPAAIPGLIRDNGNGTYTVTLHTDMYGRMPGLGTFTYKAAAITVDGVFPASAVNSAPGQDVVGTQKEIWPAVIEKAVATLAGGYANISRGGNAISAIELLTGHVAAGIAPANISLPMLQSWVTGGNPVVMATKPAGPLPFNLLANHAYALDSLPIVGGVQTVRLDNPWGYNQPELIPFAQFGAGIAEVDIGRVG